MHLADRQPGMSGGRTHRFLGHLTVCAAVVVSLWSQPSVAQSGATPSALPLVQPADLRYLGSFSVPSSDGTSGDTGRLTYGGWALGVSGRGLYIGCHAWHTRLAEVSIPEVGGVANVLTGCAEIPNVQGVAPGGGTVNLGGSLLWNGRLIVSAYAFYDAASQSRTSHFAGQPGITGMVGPVGVGSEDPGMVAGYMGLIPNEWRASLGGVAITGQGALSIISRSSQGPAAFVFNPDDVGRVNPVPASPLLYYPYSGTAGSNHPLADANQPNTLYTRADDYAGVAFPAGTRSVLFLGRHGAGQPCYGTGAACNDPTGSGSGEHAYPYVHQVWAYDANDLLRSRQGQLAPWDVRPYATWRLTEMNDSDSAKMAGATYDPATRRLYVTEEYGEEPRVHVYEISSAVGQTPAPPPPPPTQGPTAPSQLNAFVQGSTATLTWSPPTSGQLAGYVLEAGSAAALADLVQIPIAANATSFVTEAPVGRYFVRLRAIAPTGASSAPSNEVQVLVGLASAMSGPENFRARVAGPSVVFYWDTPAAGDSVSDYVLEAGSVAGSTDVAAGSVGAAQAALVNSVPPGVYFTRLRARYPLGLSEPSSEVAVTVGAPATRPASPINLQAQVGPGGAVTVSWLPPSSGSAATGFLLEAGSARGRSEFGVFPIGPVPVFRVAGVAPGTYYVRVRSSNTAGVSGPSNEVRLSVN